MKNKRKKRKAKSVAPSDAIDNDRQDDNGDDNDGNDVEQPLKVGVETPQLEYIYISNYDFL